MLDGFHKYFLWDPQLIGEIRGQFTQIQWRIRGKGSKHVIPLLQEGFWIGTYALGPKIWDLPLKGMSLAQNSLEVNQLIIETWLPSSIRPRAFEGLEWSIDMVEKYLRNVITVFVKFVAPSSPRNTDKTFHGPFLQNGCYGDKLFTDRLLRGGN